MGYSAVVTLVLLSIGSAASAADMITSDPYPQPSYATAQVAYTGNGQECNDLLIVYQEPHVPQREVVTVCHPPFPYKWKR